MKFYNGSSCIHTSIEEKVEVSVIHISFEGNGYPNISRVFILIARSINI